MLLGSCQFLGLAPSISQSCVPLPRSLPAEAFLFKLAITGASCSLIRPLTCSQGPRLHQMSTSRTVFRPADPHCSAQLLPHSAWSRLLFATPQGHTGLKEHWGLVWLQHSRSRSSAQHKQGITRFQGSCFMSSLGSTTFKGFTELINKALLPSESQADWEKPHTSRKYKSIRGFALRGGSEARPLILPTRRQ